MIESIPKVEIENIKNDMNCNNSAGDDNLDNEKIENEDHNNNNREHPIIGDNNNNDEYPPDASNNRPIVQVVRQILFSTKQLMTPSQVTTYKKQDGKAQSYDRISLFSLRPSLLLVVFTNPVDHFRLCDMMLNSELKTYRWVDCLGS